MLTAIHPKLPMRNKDATKDFYISKLGFEVWGNADYEGYLMLSRDQIQVHFFSHPNLDPAENYGQVYIRTNQIKALYESLVQRGVRLHPAGHLALKPWGQWEFSLLDPDQNLLTFGEDA